MKNIFFLLLFTLSQVQLTSQTIEWQSNNVAGFEIFKNDIDYSYSIGQVFSSYLYKGKDIMAVQGYQQVTTYAKIKPVNVSNQKVSIKAYPNPTKDFVWFIIYNPGEILIKVYDNLGRDLGISTTLKGNENRKTAEFNLKNFEYGMYIFHIYNDNLLVATTKIIKL